jgi:hypothetical protein
MISFINLMASDVWSEADIKNRLHAEIRSQVSEQAETELSRALQGAALGMHTLTQQEQASLMAFKVATDRVAALGVQARADAALLAEVMVLEVHARRLALPAVEPVMGLGAEPDDELVVINVDEVATDTAERDAAEAALAGATEAATALLALRNPSDGVPA